ncbi:MAG: phenylalanine--tRNA ligase subunit alpha [Thermoanaerobaculia bacterium]|nr:phenylalanine--tRNA ligase subunit alpha [Thermoanaerobaculia bacterium]
MTETKTIQNEIDELRQEFDESLEKSDTLEDLDQIRIRYFGRKGGLIPALFSRMKDIPPEERKSAGAAINAFRDDVDRRLNEKIDAAKKSSRATKKKRQTIDVTLPGRRPSYGHLHPVTIVRREIEGIFREMGYSLLAGPEIDTDWYNFEALNFQPEHPARDEQDTFYLPGDLLLRTHTSNVQIHAMQTIKPPVKVIASGRVYRRDEITLRRSPMFHQIEGLLVDEGIHFGHLKGTLEHFIHKLYGESSSLRFRPSYFPFTEPSAEVDMSCVFCQGDGCGTCSQTGWMEILGCGMVHPNVLKNVGIDPERYTGFAFGLGIDRAAMLRFDIPNIRVLFENDLRVLRQF